MDQTAPGKEDDMRWRAVAERRPGGNFVYAVTTTGIFCRSGCASRLPNRENVRFFASGDDAITAGYRACKRCRPDQARHSDVRLAVVAEACRIIEAADTPPALNDLASKTGYSPHHLHRLFDAVVGVTPKQYGDALRAARLRKGLRSGNGVADAVYGAGYGSASRVYENSSALLGMTPASYAAGGRGAVVRYALSDSPLGRILAAATPVGLCMVSLGSDDKALVSELQADLPQADVIRDDEALGATMADVIAYLDGKQSAPTLALDIRATAFQWQVWRALSEIPAGETRTYGQLAARLGKPKAARAVGRACATNPVSLVVPCHRAVGADGSLTGYRWGTDRKRTLLARERMLNIEDTADD